MPPKLLLHFLFCSSNMKSGRVIIIIVIVKSGRVIIIIVIVIVLSTVFCLFLLSSDV